MGKKPVRSPVERHGADTGEVEAQHLACRTCLSQPAVGLALRSRVRHAGDDGAQGTAPLTPVEAQRVKQSGKAQHLQGLPCGMLDTDGAAVHVAGRPDIDGLPVRPVRLPALTLQQAPGNAPGLGLDLRRERLQGERGPALDQLLDAGTQQGPGLALDGEVPAQVEQGDLAYLAVLAAGLDEALREACGAVPCGAGLGGADEHGVTVGLGRRGARG